MTGVTTNTEDITLATAGALTLNQAVSTGAGNTNTVRLQAAGDVTQAAAGTITALNLGVFDSAGNITLNQSNGVGTNAATGTFAAQDTDGATPGTIVFKDSTTGTLQTGVVASSGVFTNTVTGAASNAGNITLTTTGNLTLNQAVTTGSGASGTRAAAGVRRHYVQVAAGIITRPSTPSGVFQSTGNITLMPVERGRNRTRRRGRLRLEHSGATNASIVFKDATTGTLQIDTVHVVNRVHEHRHRSRLEHGQHHALDGRRIDAESTGELRVQRQRHGAITG